MFHTGYYRMAKNYMHILDRHPGNQYVRPSTEVNPTLKVLGLAILF